MNPQANLLNSAGILSLVEDEVKNFLLKHKGHEYSSSEIYINMPQSIKTQIEGIAKKYTGPLSSEAGYIGVVAAMIAKDIKNNISHNSKCYCHILNRYDDGFKI
ncbi:hypothetical protein [Clostridium ihumii]|uniref:hypothetical protein n=1 Tax=Clostridium ihumii TaxID=1470356 RepID=UPI00058B14AF|nr:hypothetical protein [Clostridium ihumii]